MFVCSGVCKCVCVSVCVCVCVWKPLPGMNVRGRTHVNSVLIPTILLVCGNNVEINTNYGRVCNTQAEG